MRIKSRFTYHAFRLVFVSIDKRRTISFQRVHFHEVDADVQDVDAATVAKSTTPPVAGRPDSVHQAAWAALKLPGDASEWMWGPERRDRHKHKWFQYGCVVDRELLKPPSPFRCARASAKHRRTNKFRAFHRTHHAPP